MATKKPVKSRVAQSAKKSSFRFRPWMAIVLVVLVALVGIAILRSSHAFGGGKIYINGGNEGPYVEYDFNIDGSVNLKESITGAVRKNVPFSQANAVGLQMVQDALTKIGQDPSTTIDPANLPPSVTEQIGAAKQQAPASKNTPTTTQTTPTTPTTQEPPATATSPTTPTSQDTQTSSSTSQPKAKTYAVSGVSEFQLPTSIVSSAKVVVFQVDGKTVSTVKKAPFTLSLDSTKFENGSHLLQAEVQNTDGSKHTYIYAIEVQNRNNFWSNFLQRLSGIFG